MVRQLDLHSPVFFPALLPSLLVGCLHPVFLQADSPAVRYCGWFIFTLSECTSQAPRHSLLVVALPAVALPVLVCPPFPLMAQGLLVACLVGTLVVLLHRKLR